MLSTIGLIYGLYGALIHGLILYLILRPEGIAVSDTRPMSRLNISVIVEENGRRESGGTGGGCRKGTAKRTPGRTSGRASRRNRRGGCKQRPDQDRDREETAFDHLSTGSAKSATFVGPDFSRAVMATRSA